MEAIRQGDIPGVQLRRRVDVPGCSPARMWGFWTEAARQSRWLCDRARVDPGPALVFRFERDLSQGGVRRDYAEVVESVEPERLVLGWRELDAGWETSTKLTVQIAATASGSHVMVFQEGFQQLPLSVGLTAWEHARGRWSRALERLATIAAAGPST